MTSIALATIRIHTAKQSEHSAQARLARALECGDLGQIRLAAREAARWAQEYRDAVERLISVAG